MDSVKATTVTGKLGEGAHVHRNLSTPQLVEAAIARGEASLADNGALVALTGARTGRSPRDKFIVRDAATSASVDWGKVNQPFDPARFEALLTRVVAPVTGSLPVYITENGSSWYDYLTQDGRINDDERVSYLRDHLAAAHAAIADGVNLRGYFAWSLLDNYEWAEGYAKRFGLVYVDFATQQRILKRSGEFYAEVTRANAVPAG